MEKCDLHGLPGRAYRLSSARWRRGKVQHRFRHPKKQQCNAVAGRKQHRKPGMKAVLWVSMVWPELDVAPFGERDTDNKYQEKRYRQHVEPAKGDEDVRDRCSEGLSGLRRVSDGADHNYIYNNDGGQKYWKENSRAGARLLIRRCCVRHEDSLGETGRPLCLRAMNFYRWLLTIRATYHNIVPAVSTRTNCSAPYAGIPDGLFG